MPLFVTGICYDATAGVIAIQVHARPSAEDKRSLQGEKS